MALRLQLTAENADLSRQVDEALLRQTELGMQMKELQVCGLLVLFVLICLHLFHLKYCLLHKLHTWS